MARKKYRYRDRATAEAAELAACEDRRRYSQVCDGILNGTARHVGDHQESAVYFVPLQHSALVYMIGTTRYNGEPRLVLREAWDMDGPELGHLITTFLRSEQDLPLGRLLESARNQAYKALLSAA